VNDLEQRAWKILLSFVPLVEFDRPQLIHATLTDGIRIAAVFASGRVDVGVWCHLDKHCADLRNETMANAGLRLFQALY